MGGKLFVDCSPTRSKFKNVIYRDYDSLMPLFFCSTFDSEVYSSWRHERRNGNVLVYIYYESLVVLQCCFWPFFSSTLRSCSWGYEHASIRSIISEFVTVSDSSKWTAERLFFRCGRIHETVQIVNQLTELTDWLKMTELTLFTFWLLKYYFIDVLTDKAEYGAKRNLAENLVKPFLIWEVRLCCESRYL